jgi:hypothetical protein
MRLRRIEVRGRPYILFLDPCNVCNLRCPLCPTGMKKLGRSQGMMSLDCFKRYLDPHVPYLFEVNCHNWGESLINEDIFDMIAHAQSRNVGTNMSSNLAIAQDHHLDGLIESGLEHLTVSVDGADQASYAQYRVRGHFDRVVENMARLVEKRGRKGRGPYIEWDRPHPLHPRRAAVRGQEPQGAGRRVVPQALHRPRQRQGHPADLRPGRSPGAVLLSLPLDGHQHRRRRLALLHRL